MKQIKKVLAIVVPIAPFRMLIYFLLSLPGAILPTVMLFLQREIVDRAVNLQQEVSLAYYRQPIFWLVGTYMIWKLFALASNQYMEFGYFRYVFMGLDRQIHNKSAKISLEYYDNATYYQMVQKAKQASMFLVFTANLVILSFFLCCNVLSVGGYLSTLHPLLIFFVILVSVPVIIEKIQGAKLQANFIQNTVQATRRKKYAFGLLLDANQKKEIAHYGASDYIAQKYLAACREVTTEEKKHIWEMGKNQLGLAGVKSLFHGMAVFLMVGLLITDHITVGSFSVLLASFSTLTHTFTQLCQHAGEILQTSAMSTSFFTFMDLEVVDGRRKLESKGEFARLEQVSYQYLYAKDFALKDISFFIKEGEKIAIVGENGAGKTTLAKLLSGFFVPTEGRMMLGGVLRSELQENGIFDSISAVYQEFGRYKLTIGQNVYLGDTETSMDRERIGKALDWAGISRLKYSEETNLGREFGGVELSGGQWQRLALARSYYRERPILFLDEPTASIDPLEEMEIYHKLDGLAQKRTVILVTHRLGAVRDADRILVLDKGRIVEEGDFVQLMEQKGHFYHIWMEQSKWYQEQ